MLLKAWAKLWPVTLQTLCRLTHTRSLKSTVQAQVHKHREIDWNTQMHPRTPSVYLCPAQYPLSSVCACPWSGPLLSPMKPPCMPLLMHFLFIAQRNFMSFTLSFLLFPPPPPPPLYPSFSLLLIWTQTLFLFAPYLIWLFKSTPSPGSIPFGRLSFFVLYTPHPSWFSSPPSETFPLPIYPSTFISP